MGVLTMCLSSDAPALVTYSRSAGMWSRPPSIRSCVYVSDDGEEGFEVGKGRLGARRGWLFRRTWSSVSSRMMLGCLVAAGQRGCEANVFVCVYSKGKQNNNRKSAHLRLALQHRDRPLQRAPQPQGSES